MEVWVGNKQAKVTYAGRSGCCVGIDQVVFERADTPHDLLRGIQLLVDLQLLQALFDQGELVSGVIDHELGREPECVGFPT